MTTDKLYETLTFMVDADEGLRLQATLEAVTNTLATLVNAPAQPAQQSALAGALSTFSSRADELKERLTPALLSAINELGGTEFFDPAIAGDVQSSIAANAMTPSVARDFVQDLATRRSNFLAVVRQTIVGLKALGVTNEPLEPGGADLAFLIPRELFDNELGSFAKELIFLGRFLKDLSECLSGAAEPVILKGLSSSVPTIGLEAGIAVIAAVASLVDKFLQAWERIEKIRKARADIRALGLKGKAVEELTDQIETTVTEVVETSTEIALSNYKGDQARKNELRSALLRDTRRLFGQIERGLIVQFSTSADGDDTEESQATLADIDRISRSLKFPQTKDEPILLSNGEVIEGEMKVRSTSKSTKTSNTVTTKRKVPS